MGRPCYFSLLAPFALWRALYVCRISTHHYFSLFSLFRRRREKQITSLFDKMPSCKSKQCSPLVKEAFHSVHASCVKKTDRNNGSNKTGLFLNKYSPLIKFEEEEWYHVCHNMDTNFKRKRIPECIPCFQEASPTSIMMQESY